MAEFAIDHVQRTEVVEPDGGSISIPFGPPTPGQVLVFLFAKEAFGAPPAPAGPPPRRTSPASSAGRSAAPVPMLRPGIGRDAGLSAAEVALRARPLDDRPGGPGGIGD